MSSTFDPESPEMRQAFSTVLRALPWRDRKILEVQEKAIKVAKILGYEAEGSQWFKNDDFEIRVDFDNNTYIGYKGRGYFGGEVPPVLGRKMIKSLNELYEKAKEKEFHSRHNPIKA